MPRGREIVGLPVINLGQGEEIGRIQDLLCDADRREVSGLILSGGKLQSGPRIIGMKQVQARSDDAFTIKDPPEPVEASDYVKWQQMKGRRVFTEQGKEVGTLEDLLIEVPSGKWEGIEVSDSLVSDILRGRKTIAIDKVLTWGSDVIIVQEEV